MWHESQEGPTSLNIEILFDEKCKEMWTIADKYVHGAGSLT